MNEIIVFDVDNNGPRSHTLVRNGAQKLDRELNLQTNPLKITGVNSIFYYFYLKPFQTNEHEKVAVTEKRFSVRGPIYFSVRIKTWPPVETTKKESHY